MATKADSGMRFAASKELDGGTVVSVEVVLPSSLFPSANWSRPGASLDRVAVKRNLHTALSRAAGQALEECQVAAMAQWDRDNPGTEPVMPGPLALDLDEASVDHYATRKAAR